MKRVQFKRTKSVISIVLSLVLILSIFAALPVHAGAAETNVAATAADEVYTVSNENELLTAVAEINQKTSGEYDILLSQDIKCDAGISFENASVIVNIKGQGHKLSSVTSAIVVKNGSTVNLGDGNTSLAITCATNNDTPGIVYIVGAGSTCNMNKGVTLKDHKGDNYYGGGVTVEGGIFNMNGGTIENCGISGGSVCYGGGVGVSFGGQFIMNGGTIKDCYVESDFSNPRTIDGVPFTMNPDVTYVAGGGVFVYCGGVFVMNGGAIEECTASCPGDYPSLGGGIASITSRNSVDTYRKIGKYDSSVNIFSGKISSCSADLGGALGIGRKEGQLEPLATGVPTIVPSPYNEGIIISGGNYSDNSARMLGGGLYFDRLRSSVNVSASNLTLSGNKAPEGGAVCVDTYWTNATFDTCFFNENKATAGKGGAIFLNGKIDTTESIKPTISIINTEIKNNTATDKGGGIYYTKESDLILKGANNIQDNTVNGKTNNLYFLGTENPVIVGDSLEGSQIGITDAKLWEDGKEDIAPDAESSDYLTAGFKATNEELVPEKAFTSDHESWYVDYGEKKTEQGPVIGRKYTYTGKTYNVVSRKTGNTYGNGTIIDVKAVTFTSGKADTKEKLYNELTARYTQEYTKTDNNKYTDPVSGSKIEVINYPTVPNMVHIKVDGKYIMAKVDDQSKVDSGHLALSIVNTYLDDAVYSESATEETIELKNSIGTSDLTKYNYNDIGHTVSKTVILKSTEKEEIQYDTITTDYTNEVRLVRRSEPIKFHVNEPEKDDRLFRVYNPKVGENYTAVENGTHPLNENYRISEFYNIPSFAGDEYVFAGWYYNAKGDEDGNIPFQFDSEIPGNLTDVYAHWIPVGKVAKDDNDDKVLPGNAKTYSGFKLFGVQIRPEANFDSNYGDGKPGGLRFITSISEELLNNVDALSEKKVNGNKVEYGFVTAATNTVDTFVGDSEYLHLSGEPKADYTLKYKGVNVNGVDTTVKGKDINNYNYVTNVDCTSQVGEFGSNARIKEDHRNYSDYRLATYVVTYDGSEADKGAEIVARAYMRYYDANGLLRTFYNNYNGSSNAYGGCSTSYDSVEKIASNTKTAQ